MAKVNDILVEVRESTTGGSGSRKLYKVTYETEGVRYILAHTSVQAGKIAAQMATDLAEAITVAVAVTTVYEQQTVAVINGAD